MARPESERSRAETEKQKAQHYVEIGVHANEDIMNLQRQLKRECPALRLRTPESLHVTLGYFGSKEDLMKRLRASGVRLTPKFISMRWLELLRELEYIIPDPTFLKFDELAVFDNGALVLTVNKRQEFAELKQHIYDAFLRMLTKLGLSPEQSVTFIKEGRYTKYLDPTTTRFHITIAKIPEGTQYSPRKVPEIQAWAAPSRLKRRMKA